MKTANDNFAAVFGHVEAVAPEILEKTGAKTFHPITCTKCKEKPTQHYCKVSLEKGGYYIDNPTNTFCGRAFCVPCAVKYGYKFGNGKCAVHIGFIRSFRDKINIEQVFCSTI